MTSRETKDRGSETNWSRRSGEIGNRENIK